MNTTQQNALEGFLKVEARVEVFYWCTAEARGSVYRVRALEATDDCELDYLFELAHIVSHVFR